MYENLESNPRGFNIPNAVIVDLDGTLALHNGRSPYDFAKCETDLVNESIKHIVNTYANTHIILIVSGRDDWCKPHCERWLKEHQVRFDEIIMRVTGDKRSDDIVKEEIYNNQIRDKYNIRFVLDDRLRVVRKWFQLGLCVLRVGDPDANF